VSGAQSFPAQSEVQREAGLIFQSSEHKQKSKARSESLRNGFRLCCINAAQ